MARSPRSAAKIVAPKGIKVIEAKGLRVYPGMIDSGTDLGLSEIAAVRETVDTGEIGRVHAAASKR